MDPPCPTHTLPHSPVSSSLSAGSYDNKIVMWDIGGVDGQYNYKVVCVSV